MRVSAKAKVTFSNRAWRELADNVNELGRSHVKVGILAGKGADTPGDDTSLTLAQIAAIHEYGAPAANIPERSFLRSTFRRHSAALGSTTARLAKLVLARKLTNTAALNLLGMWASSKVKREITGAQHIPPPLAEKRSPTGRLLWSTAERKGSDRPLVDTGQLVNSITHVVSTGIGDDA